MEKIQFKLLLPADVAQLIDDAAQKSLRSKSAEIVFALRSHYGQTERAK